MLEADLEEQQNYEIINGRRVVKKHVAAIHCANKLSLLERKVSNALLYHAFPTLRQELTHELTLQELKNLLGYRTNNNLGLKNALKKLISIVIEWNLCGDRLPDDLEGWNASSILASVSINGGVIKYQYSELIKTLLASPSVYGKINLGIQARFKSSYALALYENCARYRGLPSTKTFDIDLFRKLMGVPPDSYKKFSLFEKKVICQAVAEVNTASDIRVEPKLFKRGRKVIAIRFQLVEQKQMKRFGLSEPSKATIEAPGKQHEKSGILEREMKKMIALYGKERVDEAVSYVKSTPQYKSGQVKNIGGYVRSAITNEYSKTTQVQTDEKKISTKKQQEDALITQIKSNYRQDYQPAELYNICQKLPTDKKKEIEAGFLTQGKKFHGRLAEAILKNHQGIDNSTLFNPGNGGIVLYLQAFYPDIFEGVMTEEDYIDYCSKEAQLA
jgi:plasmid replication initiation protein